METSLKNKVWYYFGKGMEDFGVHDKAIIETKRSITDYELLARVDAVAICASDIKMIKLANEYPLFKGRDFITQPAILGHELSLTIEQVGKHLSSDWKVGMRLGIQPDVYMHAQRYCVGVNVEGGFQEYMILDTSVFNSDYGVTVFPVGDELSYGTIAQLEPNACVEASYRSWIRSEFDNNEKLLLYIAQNADNEYHLDMDITHKEVHVINKSEHCKVGIEKAIRKDDISSYEMGEFGDMVILGNPSDETMKQLTNLLAHSAIFCWLPQVNPSRYIEVDVAKVHYSCIHWIGTMSKVLSKAFQQPQRFSYKKDGKLLIMGGAGAMGRIHTLRAICDKDGPKDIVVTARGKERLLTLQKDFQGIAQKHNRRLYTVSMEESQDWKGELRSIGGCYGFDDVIVSAPERDPVQSAMPFLRKDGMLILFSGTSYGQYVQLPLGDVVCSNLRINASSGSTIEDEKLVLKKIIEKAINPDKNIVAIVGLDATKQAVEAVSNGLYAGKVIVYPQLHTLPLTSIDALEAFDIPLSNHVKTHGWNREAERILYKKYGKEN